MPSLHLPFPVSASLLTLLPPSPRWCRRMGNRGCGQSVTFCHCYLLRLFPTPAWAASHGIQSFINFSNMGLSPRLQFFKNCSSMDPFNGVQSFSNGLLQHGSLMGSQKTHSCVGSSPWVSPPARSLFFYGCPQAAASLRAHPPAPAWSPPWAAGGDLLHCGLPWHAGAQPASPWSSSWAAGEKSLLWRLEHLLPLLLHWPWCLQGTFSYVFILFFLTAVAQCF